jgi:hypothetical protein
MISEPFGFSDHTGSISQLPFSDKAVSQDLYAGVEQFAIQSRM